MDIATIKAIFIDELAGAERGAAIDLPHGTRVTVFLNTPGGVLPLGKVEGVTFKETYAVFDSDEGRVFATIDAVAAIRADQEGRGVREGRVGFG